jgi:hypothetical protein
MKKKIKFQKKICKFCAMYPYKSFCEPEFTETNKNLQKQTKIYRNKQKFTETNKNLQKQTEIYRNK